MGWLDWLKSRPGWPFDNWGPFASEEIGYFAADAALRVPGQWPDAERMVILHPAAWTAVLEYYITAYLPKDLKLYTLDAKDCENYAVHLLRCMQAITRPGDACAKIVTVKSPNLLQPHETVVTLCRELGVLTPYIVDITPRGAFRYPPAGDKWHLFKYKWDYPYWEIDWDAYKQ